MKRTGILVLLAAGLAWFPAASLDADVKTQEKGHVKFEGALGRVVNMFGGKAAREGVVTNVAVSGDRKATMHDGGGQIVDLAEEKIYDIDTRRKTYKVTTFEELRQQMREAQARAAKEAREDTDAPDEPGEPGKEVEIDFDVKETGARKEIAGHSTRQVVVTITAREKGKTLEEGGGLVLTSDTWMAETLPAMKEIQDFDRRYAQKLDLAGAAGTSAQQMATAMAMFPGLQKAMERMQAEGTKLDGTPLESTMLVESVKSPDQMAQAPQEDSSGGMGGILARKMMRKKQEPQSARGTIMTINHQVLSIATSVSPAELEIPAGFKPRS
jgi:hypothetical protein